MAFPITKSLCFFSFLLAFSTVSDARRYGVGGSGAWVPNPPEDYGSWAGKSRFLVHDTLYFTYAKGADSVLEVNKADYDGCNTKNPIKKADDGNSEMSLDRSGPFYFISGNKDNCKKGQKVTIVVISVRTSTPPGSSMPPKSSSPVSPMTSPPAPTPPKSSSPVSPSSAPVTSPPAPTPPKSASPGSPSSAPATSPPGSSSPVSPSSAPVTSPPGSMSPMTSPPGSMSPMTSPPSPPSSSPGSSPSGSMAPKSSSAGSPSLAPGGSPSSISSPPSGMGPTGDAPSGSAMGPSGDGPSSSGDINAPAGAPDEKKSSANGMTVMSVRDKGVCVLAPVGNYRRLCS
ncbi:unnamed protein product [Eruca vesicaria subsp. sativa]|uniref:Phytocyanin domain-containing protein n=1 Tax=Eruca vesicaria subsp. sativa TaxID=29727 RepID=A0ABC8J8X9_ERUVS|nr:unnamed protein product [Eruca vesicaria subsp. sativa]